MALVPGLSNVPASRSNAGPTDEERNRLLLQQKAAANNASSTGTSLNPLSHYTTDIQFGGSQNGAAMMLDQSRAREAAAIGRQGTQIQYDPTSLATASGLAAQSAGMDARQTQALGMLQQQAAGNGPSAAGINAGLGGQSALQAALAGQAMGKSSLANAAMGHQAMMAGGQTQLANAAQLGQARMQEIAGAQQAFGGAAADQRMANYSLANAMTGTAGIQSSLANAQGQLNMDQSRQNLSYAQAQEQSRLALGQTLAQGDIAAQDRINRDASQAYRLDAANQARYNLITGTAIGTAGSMLGQGATASANPATAPTSDERAKTPAWDVLPIGDQPGSALRYDDSGRGYLQPVAEAQPMRPSLASAVIIEPEKVAKAKSKAGGDEKRARKMTPDELMAAANAMEAENQAYYRDQLARGAAVRAHEPDSGVLADANRQMAGQPYRYRPEFTPPDEVPGQIHHGFMAQNLERNPVTATAVEKGPDGVRRVHTNRMLQAVASGVADLQRQMDETRAAMRGR